MPWMFGITGELIVLILDVPGWSFFLFDMFGFLTLPPCYNIDNIIEREGKRELLIGATTRVYIGTQALIINQ